MKKQKYDREDARLLLRLMREDNFPKIWIPSSENRDVRQLLWHRKTKLWSAQGRAELEKLALGP